MKLTMDGQIYEGNKCVGFIDDERVYVYVRDTSLEIGKFDHRSEVIKMVTEHFNDNAGRTNRKR